MEKDAFILEGGAVVNNITMPTFYRKLPYFLIVYR
jgi:hypothetical protein